MAQVPRAVSRSFNPSLEEFLTQHGSDTLLRNGVSPDDFVSTHTTFNGRPAGGSFQIGGEDRDLFLKLYFQRLKRSGPFSLTPLYLNERTVRGKPFRFYVDVDMLDEHADLLFQTVADGQPLKLYRLLAATFSRIISDVTGEDEPEVLFSRRKRGKLHYQFPTVIVDDGMARSFVEMARDSLKQMHPGFALWDAIWDFGVYKSGLRMIGSRKFGGPLDEEDPIYKPHDLSSGAEMEITLETLDGYLIQPHPEKDKEAVELMLETMVGSSSRGNSVTLTRSVSAGVRATAGISDSTLDAIFSYLGELRNGAGGSEGRAGPFAGKPLSVQKITRMSEPPAENARKRHRGATGVSAAIELPMEHGFFVLLADRLCPCVSREHKRKSSYIYLTISKLGTQMRCYNEECRGLCFPEEPTALSRPLKEVFGIADDAGAASSSAGGTGAKRPGPARRKRIFGEDDTDEDENEERVARKIEEMKRMGLRFDFEAGEDDENGESLDGLMLASLSKTDFDVAKVVFYIFRDIFRADGPNDSKTIWWRFDGTRWQTKGATMKLLLSTYIPFVYSLWRTRRIEVLGITMDTWNVDEKLAYETLMLSLKRHSYKNSVSSECALLFSAAFPNFAETLDSNPKLLVCENGVLDFSGDSVLFRRGAAADNCSFSTNIKFDHTYTWNSSGVRDVLMFFRDLFPVEDTFRYALDVFARCLIGRMEEHFFVLSGSGSNGKSKLVSLMQATMGDYATEIPVSLLTGRRNKSSSASPEVMQIKGRRFVTASEPDSGESESVLNMGVVKQLTGGDQVSARNLFQTQQTFTPMSHLFLCTNDSPKFSDNSLGTWRRVRFLEMLSRFTKDPKHSYDKKIDPDMDAKMKNWTEATLWIMVQTLNEQLGKLLEDCDSVIQSNAEIRKESDHLTVFIDRHFSSAPDHMLDWDTALEQYQDFCALENVKHNRPHAVKRRLRECFGEPRYGDDDKLIYKARIKLTVSQYAMTKNRHQRM